MVPFLGNIREFSGVYIVKFFGVLEVVEKKPKRSGAVWVWKGGSESISFVSVVSKRKGGAESI